MTTSKHPAASMAPTALRDVHLMDQALAELQAIAYGGLRQVSCQVQGNHVVLSGIVPSFYQKQLAQERLRKCLGTDVRISNELEVQCSNQLGQ